MSTDAATTLLEVFTRLLPLAPAERQEAILRRALMSVLTDASDPPGRPLDSRSPAIDTSEWATLRVQIRNEMAF